MRTQLFGGMICCGLVLEGCAYVPYLEEATGGIPVREIVLRTKCELSDAFMAQDSERFKAKDVADWWGPEQPKYAWLKDWTAQADLTLQVVDTASIAPGATFTEPLPNGWGFAAGPSSFGGKTINAISQNFMVAAGANLGGQSQRIETMTFVFSLKELEAWRQRDKDNVEQNRISKSVCELSDKMDLAGRLGLKEWLAEALSPVEKDGDAGELLYANFHPKPGQAAAAPPKPGTPFQPIPPKPPGPTLFTVPPEGCETKIKNEADEISKRIDSMTSELSIAKKAKTSAEGTRSKFDKLFKSVSESNQHFRKFGETYGEVLPPERRSEEKETSEELKNFKRIGDVIKNNVDNASKFADQVDRDISKAQELVKKAKEDAKNDCKKAQNDIDSANQYADADNIKFYAKNAQANADAAIENYNTVVPMANDVNNAVSKLETIDPPIASVGQNVQFIVNYGGNVTPTWNFVRFKGPNAPLFGAQGMRTHFLNISLGPSAPPSPGGQKGAPGLARGPGTAVQQSQLNLLLTTLFPARPF